MIRKNTDPMNLGDLIEFFQGHVPVWIKKRPDYLKAVNFYKDMPYFDFQKKSNSGYVGLEVHMSSDQIDSGVPCFTQEKENLLFSAKKTYQKALKGNKYSWENAVRFSEDWVRLPNLNFVNIVWLCFDADSMDKRLGPLVFYMDFPNIPVKQVHKLVFGKGLNSACKLLLGKFYSKKNVEILNVLKQKMSHNQILRNVGVNWQNDQPRLKIFLSGTIDDNISLCKQFKQNAYQKEFLKSVSGLKSVYGQNNVGMEIDIHQGVLLKSSFEFFFDREDIRTKKFVGSFAEKPFFSNFVTKQQKRSFKKLFSEGAVVYQTHKGTILHMKPMHMKVIHDGKGKPKWKMYLNFVKHPNQ